MQGRQQHENARKLDQARLGKTKEGGEFEAELEAGQRKKGVPPQYTVGGGGERAGTMVDDPETDEAEVQGQVSNVSGADIAPTQKAREREEIRHAKERELGRAPAGHDGKLRDHRDDDVTRDDLTKAGREADAEVNQKIS